MTEPKHIRPIVICLFRHGNKILAGKHFDPADQRSFYRPVGGGIDFGEPSDVALRREVKEELGLEIENPMLIGVLENRFVYNGKAGHEIVFVYDAQSKDQSIYELEEIDATESNGVSFKCYWLDLTKIGPDHLSIGPEGLLHLLDQNQLSFRTD
jgi:8-oxo-dGTP pyrophosphatase MutT (NUDIX family)